MNRWRWAALAFLVVGLGVSFFVVPSSNSACDDMGDCGPGTGLRMMAVLFTALVTFVLFVAGAVADPKRP